MALVTAALVISLNVTRLAPPLGSARLSFSHSSKCQLIASPSRSGSVARITLSARFAASRMAESCLARSADTSHAMAKSASGFTDPSRGGRSRTWPKLASTS